MTWPAPQPGLVIRYSYLWKREALTGQEEGAKDRPCAVVLAVRDEAGRMQIYALPITHSPPTDGADAIEIPAMVKARMGLDGARKAYALTHIAEWSPADGGFVHECPTNAITAKNIDRRAMDIEPQRDPSPSGANG